MKVTDCLYCGSKKLTHITHRSDNNGILRCERCMLMMVENISDDIEETYTAAYFEKEKATKSGYTNYLSSPVANLIGKYAFSRLFARQPGNHLDLGCADGSLMEIFNSEGFSTYGLEISKDAVKIANDKGLDVSFSRLYSFPDHQPKSSLITAFDLLEHADKPGKVLNSIYDNLEEDGYFCFSTLSVKRNDPSDYWFNNSLEHYVYYNRESLTYILSDVFGKDSFGFVEKEVNGIAEFWGFAKKGAVTTERKIIDQINKGTYNKKNAETGYLFSLFYNQVSQFDTSLEIINHFEDIWPFARLVQAKFYNHFYQGKLELAVREASKGDHLLPANSIYWQALSTAEDALFRMKKNDMRKEANAEIVSLREQLFAVKDQLHTLKNSRVVGRIIKVRDYIGSQMPRAKRAPRKIAHTVKIKTAKITPGFVRRPLMRAVRHDYRARYIKTKIVANKKWNDKIPLVSVVVPYYNREDTIDDTLRSLDNQTFRNFETIIVDDGSTEAASIKKLKNLKTTGSNVTIIHQENQGVAEARNTGIGLSKGRYVICLDSDDILQPTYIEKETIVLETSPDVSVVTSYMEVFGVRHELYKHANYNPYSLHKNNTVTTAAEFRKEAWKVSGGYRSKIGYEDWEYWINLSEHGFWAKLIPEPLFKYRTAMQSRYVEDKDIHWNNLKVIRSLHPKYKTNVKKLVAKRQYDKHVIDTATAFVNLSDADTYASNTNGKKNILIAIPWMTFGGAETLILNFCREIKDTYNIHFITGLQSDNEWQYKFEEISYSIYHLPNLFEDEALYLEFIANYIKTRHIDVLHMIHTDFVFNILPEIRNRHPKLKTAVTMFNDRVPHYFKPSIDLKKYVDVYTSDNLATANHYKKELPTDKVVVTIPNGIDCYDIFNPVLFDRKTERGHLGLAKNDIAVFFIGRLSEEKNPNIYLNAAQRVLEASEKSSVKFFVIGDGGMRPAIEKQITSIGSDNITYLGYQTDIARFLSAADIFVLPSSIEGFPLSILEAMAMKVVVIASDVGAVSDVIANGADGFVVEPGSAEDISKIILLLQGDKELLDKTRIAARLKLEKGYSNATLKMNYLKLYGDVLK